MSTWARLLLYAMLCSAAANTVMAIAATRATKYQPLRRWKAISFISFGVLSVGTVGIVGFAEYNVPRRELNETKARAAESAKLAKEQDAARGYFREVYGCLFRTADRGGHPGFPQTLVDLKSTGCLDWWTSHKIELQKHGNQTSLAWKKHNYNFRYQPIIDSAFALEGSSSSGDALPSVSFDGDESGVMLWKDSYGPVVSYRDVDPVPFLQ